MLVCPVCRLHCFHPALSAPRKIEKRGDAAARERQNTRRGCENSCAKLASIECKTWIVPCEPDGCIGRASRPLRRCARHLSLVNFSLRSQLRLRDNPQK